MAYSSEQKQEMTRYRDDFYRYLNEAFPECRPRELFNSTVKKRPARTKNNEPESLLEQFESELETKQSPVWHREINVWEHTRMVCEVMRSFSRWKKGTARERFILYAAALLHDIGKTMSTRLENGDYISPNHEGLGAGMARRFLWDRCDMTGSKDLIEARETIVNLIRYHTLPCHLRERPDPLLDVTKISFLCGNDRLALLSEADVRGRICDETEKGLESLEYFRHYAREQNSYEQPLHFDSEYSRFAWFDLRLSFPTEPYCDNSWGEVILMAGLPASGKDYWIEHNVPDWPVISLDRIREELGISWLGNQDAVITTAHQRAKDYLQAKVPFVWNSTNLYRDQRAFLIRHFIDYGARVRLVYLESPLSVLRNRNSKREKAINDSAYDKMFFRIDVPSLLEAPRFEIIASR